MPSSNMPKGGIKGWAGEKRAIKKASDKKLGRLKEVLFEGYAPPRYCILVEYGYG